MASELEQTTAVSLLRLAYSDQWPGERHPTRWDVENANDVPEPTVLDRFRSALIHECEDVNLDFDLHATYDTEGGQRGGQPYTYPMILLSKAPPLPSDGDLDCLRRSFSSNFGRHILVKDFEPASYSASGLLPPYLQLALACIASVFSGSVDRGPGRAVSGDLFIAGVNVWAVMLEVDNREARSSKAVVAAVLLASYGILATDHAVWRKTSGLLCNVITMSRRLQLTESNPALLSSALPTDRDSTSKSPLLCYILLLDVLHSLHYNTPPNYSVNELFFHMPSCDQPFRSVYNALIHGFHLPEALSSEDALLLITAMLADIIYIQHSYSTTPKRFTSSMAYNPFVPLSAASERKRMTTLFEGALRRWKKLFHHQTECHIRALHHFTLLRLQFPEVSELPSLVGYGGYRRSISTQNQYAISPEAVEVAWEVLVEVEYASNTQDRRMAIWLPIVAFLSGLTVWHYDATRKRSDARSGGSRFVKMFQSAILQLPWPCCADMASTLEKLST